ncbi:hypothetical protein AVEN_150971-1 [Araneus ventricosus]|uniref:Uncharacterized protein n=1 Tax=Araneus ventricosus TaxID=182803 RepID=A0A4Y2V0F1_ARAVE|nr:hypothetical protein AVEN_150971-1 [Araneus ventricosus]
MLPSKRGFNLRKALFFSLVYFRAPVKRDFELQRFRSDFNPDGIPTTTGHLADFHRFFGLFPSSVLQFICEVNGRLYTYKRQCLCVRARCPDESIALTAMTAIWHTGSCNGDSMRLET